MQASLTGAVIIGGMVMIYLVCCLITGKLGIVSRGYNRGKDRLIRRQIANSLEESAPIHLDVGNVGEGNLACGVVLCAAEATEAVSAQMAFADEPWMITGGGGLSTTVEKDAVLTGMEAADYGNSFDSDCAVFTGVSSAIHMTGNSTALEMSPKALHLSMGEFGPVPALSDTLYNKGDALCVGGDDLLAQAVGTVTADAVYIGEQFVEIPDALARGEKKDPALFAMDVIRWILIGGIAAFIVLGLRGI